MEKLKAADALLPTALKDGEFVRGVDGFIYYFGSNVSLTSWMLRLLADELDRQNADFQASLVQYFGKE